MKRFIDVLVASGVDSMLTGSVASSIQGEPRSTHDINLWPRLQAEAEPV